MPMLGYALGLGLPPLEAEAYYGRCSMDCKERARLAQALRIATRQLCGVQIEEVNLAADEPDLVEEFGPIVEAAEAHRKAALTAFVQHLSEHRC